MLIKDKKILFQIFDFAPDKNVLRLLRLIGGFIGEGGTMRANRWGGEFKKEKFNNYKEWIDKLESEKFNFMEFKCTAGKKVKKEIGIKSVLGILELSALNDLWLPLRHFECKTNKDESIWFTYAGREMGSRWKKKVGINDSPSRLEFSVQLCEDKQEENFKKIVVDILQKYYH